MLIYYFWSCVMPFHYSGVYLEFISILQLDAINQGK